MSQKNNLPQLAFLNIGLLVCAYLGCTRTLWARTTPLTQTHVSLLGQACLLEGPFDEETLKAVHAIGPAQIYPTLSLSANTTEAQNLLKKALDTVRKSNSIPSVLDRYKEQITKRLETQKSFFVLIDSSRKSGDSKALMTLAKHYLHGESLKEFENLSKKFFGTPKAPSLQKEYLEQLFGIFSDGIEPNPEAEFHKATKKLNIQYSCSFEEMEE